MHLSAAEKNLTQRLGDWTDALVQIAQQGINYELQKKTLSSQLQSQKDLQAQAQADALARITAQAKADAASVLAQQKVTQTSAGSASSFSSLPSWALPVGISAATGLLILLVVVNRRKR